MITKYTWQTCIKREKVPRYIQCLLTSSACIRPTSQHGPKIEILFCNRVASFELCSALLSSWPALLLGKSWQNFGEKICVFPKNSQNEYFFSSPLIFPMIFPRALVEVKEMLAPIRLKKQMFCYRSAPRNIFLLLFSPPRHFFLSFFSLNSRVIWRWQVARHVVLVL